MNYIIEILKGVAGILLFAGKLPEFAWFAGITAILGKIFNPAEAE